MRILITGGTGFIGSHLANHFTDNGHEVIVIGTKTEQTPRAARFMGLHIGGVRPPNYWDATNRRFEMLGDIDVCFHLAANNDTLDLDKEEMMYANVDCPIVLFNELRHLHNCKKFIYASSASVYGNSPAPYLEDETPKNPLNPYAESKLKFDNWAMNIFRKHDDISIIGLRYTNVYGIGENHKGKRASMIHQLVQTMMKGNSPKLFWPGNQLRDWIYVKDVVKANIQALSCPHSDIFNCGSGHTESFNELVKIINRRLYTNIFPTWIDCPFNDAYQKHTEADMTKSRNILGFAPIYDIEKGIKEFIDEVKQTNII